MVGDTIGGCNNLHTSLGFFFLPTFSESMRDTRTLDTSEKYAGSINAGVDEIKNIWQKLKQQ